MRMRALFASTPLVLLIAILLLLVSDAVVPVADATVDHTANLEGRLSSERHLATTTTEKRHSDTSPANSTAPETTNINSTALIDVIRSGNGTNVSDGVSEWTVRHNESSEADMQFNITAANVTTLLPPEAEQTETWAYAILSIFSILAVALCTAAAWQRFSERRNRRGYQEIENLVV
jgi:hypothetical protein